MRINADKIASVTRNLKLDRALTLSAEICAEHGAVVAGRIVNDKSAYNTLEDVHGRMTVVHSDDIIVGALGHRNALHGYEGVLPQRVTSGQILHLLNLGGVIGECVSHNPDVGPPFEFEVLGQVLVYPQFQSRQGEPANIRMGALKSNGKTSDCKVIYVAGTCMNAGKTAAACAIVRRLAQAGYRVGGVKLTGVALKKHSKTWKDVNLSTLPSDALKIAEETIYHDAIEAAAHPATGPEAGLQEVFDAEPRTGRRISRFRGHPEACWAPFKQPPKYVTRFLHGSAARL